jgi:hypothetical protein
MVWITDQYGKRVDQNFKDVHQAISYCKTAGRMFPDLILTIERVDGYKHHYKAGRRLF